MTATITMFITSRVSSSTASQFGLKEITHSRRCRVTYIAIDFAEVPIESERHTNFTQMLLGNPKLPQLVLWEVKCCHGNC